MARPKRDEVRPPEVSLVDLRAADERVWRAGTEHDGLEFAGLELPEYVGGGVRLMECRIAGGRFGDLRFRRSRLIGCEIADVAVTTFDVAESEWTDVAVRGGRIGALSAPGATLARVALRGLRSNYVNLRGATIVDLTIEDCRIEELDLGTATVERARIDGEIDRLVLSAATCRAVDLRTVELGEIEGIAELGGTTLSSYQLTRLAPAFAEHLGIRID